MKKKLNFFIASVVVAVSFSMPTTTYSMEEFEGGTFVPGPQELDIDTVIQLHKKLSEPETASNCYKAHGTLYNLLQIYGPYSEFTGMVDKSAVSIYEKLSDCVGHALMWTNVAGENRTEYLKQQGASHLGNGTINSLISTYRSSTQDGIRELIGMLDNDIISRQQ